MLKTIKKSIGEFLLKRRYKKHTRNREVKNLLDCRSVLILTREPEDMGGMFASEFVTYLKEQKKEVNTILLPEKKKSIDKSYSSDIKVIEQGDLNFFYIPNDPAMLEQLNRDFDLLVDLSLGSDFTLKYIHALAKAKFKVGAAVNYKKRYSDLTIDVRNNPTVEYLLTQLKHYLININKNVP